MATANTEKMDFFEKVGFTFSLWGESWNAFKLNVWTFIALYLMPFVLFTMLLTFYLLPALANASDKDLLTASTVVVAVLVTLFAAFVYFLIIPALTLTQIESVKGNVISISDALTKSLKYILPFIISAIIGFFIIAGPLLVSLLLTIVFIGVVLLPFAFIWSIVAVFFLTLVPYIIVNEDLNALDAIKRSFELTKKKWQWVLAAWIVTFLISLASSLPLIGFIVGLVLGIVYLCLIPLVYIRLITEESVPAKVTSTAPKAVAPEKQVSAKKTAPKKKADTK